MLYRTELDGMGHTVPYRFGIGTWYGGIPTLGAPNGLRIVLYRYSDSVALAWGRHRDGVPWFRHMPCLIEPLS